MLGDEDIASEITLVSRMIIRLRSLDPWFRDRFAWRNFKFYSTKGGKYLTNRLTKVLHGLLRFAQLAFQNLSCFLLHGTSVLGGANAELALRGLRQLTDCNAGHAIND